MSKTVLVPYSVAAPQMQKADLLEWRPHGKLLARVRGWVVAVLTRSGRHCHASMVAVMGSDWRYGNIPRPTLTTIGTEEGRGGIEEDLEPLVEKYPGKIDVYQANPDNRWPDFDRDATVAWARKHVIGTKYGWWATARCALSRFIFLRWMPYFTPDRDDEDNGTKPPNCSAAWSMAVRLGGGVDPVHELSDLATEPGDLTRTPFTKYLFTLVPDGWEE